VTGDRGLRFIAKKNCNKLHEKSQRDLQNLSEKLTVALRWSNRGRADEDRRRCKRSCTMRPWRGEEQKREERSKSGGKKLSELKKAVRSLSQIAAAK